MKLPTSKPWLAPLLWAVVGFAVYFRYAQSIVAVSWNAVELIIAQHVLDHGTYALSLDFPSALTWRPILPTLLVTAVRWCTDEPIRIYQLYCGTMAASVAAGSFLSARLVWGRAAGHLAAGLALLCPAVTTSLIHQAHSYSHLGALTFLAPTIYLSLRLVRAVDAGTPARGRAYFFTGIAWGLSFLCRSEFLLYWGWLLLVLAWAHWRRKIRVAPLLALIGGFAVFYVPYNLYADRVAARDGLLIRKAIYGFYGSQGWVDPKPGAGPDVEAEGYRYAQELYGTPEENGESLRRAIAHNPPAFLRRVQLNGARLYSLLWNREFLGGWVLLLAGGLVAAAWRSRLVDRNRSAIAFLAGLFAAAHFVLIFHVDPRYLTIAVPGLLLLAVGALTTAWARLDAFSRPIRWVLLLSVGGALAFAIAPWARPLQHPGKNNGVSLRAFRALGEHFRTAAATYRSAANREPHLMFVPPANSPVAPEDHFLLAYYSHTAWYNGDAEGFFPRGRIYSYRNCPLDFLYVPAERIHDPALMGGGTIVANCDNPVLGKYYLVQFGLAREP